MPARLWSRQAACARFLRRAGWHKIARASLHQWEEPSISGTNGSGAIFFLRLYRCAAAFVKIIKSARKALDRK